ncbi:substrate-specific activator of APC-dependent proteolysis [Linnemannia schmuckeri]|uniref:Substrate-specific activator of APC-dependent proteolysis n=1 Tax=Linnemannia schmuckeri TaxID=64567 RepID=A0A9P5V966_9FUNG|nr:substrate-specific activator of APC-dependent proteolysis [Linnemannia schmuckeri]
MAMDSQFKKRLQAMQQSTARQPLPQHLPLMLSPPRMTDTSTNINTHLAGRSIGGPVRNNTPAARAMRVRVPAATRAGIGRNLFGNSSNTSLSTASSTASNTPASASTSTSISAVAARAAAAISSEVESTPAPAPAPRRGTRARRTSPTRSSTRRSAAAGLANQVASANTRNASNAPTRPETRNNTRNTADSSIAGTLASTSSHNNTSAPSTRSSTNSNGNNGDDSGGSSSRTLHEINPINNTNNGNESDSSEHDSDAENNAPPGFKPPPRSEFIIRRSRPVEGVSSSSMFDSHDYPPSPSGMRSPTMRSPGLRSPSKKLVYDRFIPMRERDLSELYDLHEAPSTPTRPRSKNQPMTPGQTHVTDHYRQAQNQAHDSVIANELMLTDPRSPYDPSLNSPRRLFTYSSTTTHNTMHFDSPSRQIYAPTPVSQESRNILLSPRKGQRVISRVPFKVLDAPDLKDDFYLNLVDWSSKNVLGVGLGSSVYLWSAATGNVHQLCDVGSPDTVTSLSWTGSASYLAVGTDKGDIQIWDVAVQKRIRTMTGHTQRVGVLAWSDHTLTSGSRDRKIYHRDVRTQEMYQQTLISHSGEVCGLKWNGSGTQLASGGNDNRLIIWDKESTKPQFQFRTHQAAVKAIDWNPHQAGVLASGGGTADRHIRFWNTMTGTSIGAHDTGSQVCNLAWSKTTNELVSTHGYSQNQVLVWKYPSMHQIASLPGHTLRVLYLALSPDGQTIVTGAGDETLRFWNVFQKSKSERRDDDGLSGAITTIR